MHSTDKTTLIVFKQANTNSNPVSPFPSEDRRIASHKIFEITDLGKRQIEALKEAFRSISFDVMIASPLDRAQKTIRPIYEEHHDHKSDLQLVTINEWEEVNLGDLDGKTAKEIQDLFVQHFPETPIPKDFNDCMNSNWPPRGETQYDFESYETFAVRINEVTQKTLRDYFGKTIGLCTHTENMRNLVMDSVGTEKLFKTKFGQEICSKLKAKCKEKIEETDFFQKTLGQLGLTRGDFKPNDAAYMKLSTNPSSPVLQLHWTYNFVIR